MYRVDAERTCGTAATGGRAGLIVGGLAEGTITRARRTSAIRENRLLSATIMRGRESRAGDSPKLLDVCGAPVVGAMAATVGCSTGA